MKQSFQFLSFFFSTLWYSCPLSAPLDLSVLQLQGPFIPLCCLTISFSRNREVARRRIRILILSRSCATQEICINSELYNFPPCTFLSFSKEQGICLYVCIPFFSLASAYL